MATVFDDLDKAMLATLAREYLLCGHLIDRSGMPHVLAAGGIDAMREVAIEEWMGASPVYTRRIRSLLGITATDVASIFKGMQVDIGAPPTFMDFRYSVSDADHGEFELAHCGALMDVEPMGEEFVVTMCHHIEDPTFDATAAATNPKARMRPVHRPPRVPAGRTPHCLWTVEIDEANEPLEMPEQATRIARTRAAAIVLDTPEGPDDDGRTDYAGELEPDLHFADFSRHTLIALLQEICLQGHLLTLSFADSVERRFGQEVSHEIVRKQLLGIAGVAAARLKRALATDDVRTVLDLHPALHPRSYIDAVVSGTSVEIRDCPALGDRPGHSWADVLAVDPVAPIDAIVQAVDPARAEERVRREVAVTQISTGADFEIETR